MDLTARKSILFYINVPSVEFFKAVSKIKFILTLSKTMFIRYKYIRLMKQFIKNTSIY